MNKSKNFYIYIYNAIKDGKYPSKIAKELFPNETKGRQKVNYYISFLKNKGLISKIDNKNYAGWEVLKEMDELELVKISQGRCKNKKVIRDEAENIITNLHALEIKFPILSGEVKDKSWEIKNKLNNWLPKYKGLDSLGGLTIRNNNNKTITVFAKSRNIKNLEEVDNLAFKIRAYIYEYFKSKHNVELDVFNCETKNLNLATEDRQSECMIKKGEKFELNLNKTAEKVFEKDNIKAKAWIDGSPFSFSAETNDKEWKRAYLTMPFIIMGLSNSMPAIQEYTKQIMLHMEVQKKQLETQELIQKAVNELRNEIKSLNERREHDRTTNIN